MRDRRRRVSLALLLAAAALSCAGLAMLLQAPARASAAELEQAEERWAQRSFGSYELRLHNKRCQLVTHVRNERVVRVEPNRCEPAPGTVTELFSFIRRDGTISLRCIALGCACDDVMTVRAVYDPQLGYPTSIDVRVAARPNWQHPDYWTRLFARRTLPDCSVLAEGSKVMKVDALTPLP